MQVALLAINMVAGVVIMTCVLSGLISETRNRDWRNELIIGICVVVIIAGDITRLLAFGQSRGWAGSLKMVLLATFAGWTFGRAKKLRASQRGVKKNG